jgi:hypothetical protein
MAEPTITEESLKSALIDRLKATHVEVTDMSGKLQTQPLQPVSLRPLPKLGATALTNHNLRGTNGYGHRRLWPILHLPNSISPIHRPQLAEAAPRSQCRPQARNSNHTRVECKMPDARGVGEGQGEDWRGRKAANGWHGWRKGSGY